MPAFTQGICQDGAVILKDGAPMTPDDIITALRALDFLLEVKAMKNTPSLHVLHEENKELAWTKARQSLR